MGPAPIAIQAIALAARRRRPTETAPPSHRRPSPPSPQLPATPARHRPSIPPPQAMALDPATQGTDDATALGHRQRARGLPPLHPCSPPHLGASLWHPFPSIPFPCVLGFGEASLSFHPIPLCARVWGQLIFLYFFLGGRKDETNVRKD